MFEPFAGLLVPLIEVLSKKISKSNKRNIGKELARLYINLNEVIENGEEILRLLENALKKVKIDPRLLLKLLFSQAERIRGIRSVIEKSHIETILKIHLPRLADLQILLEMKGDRVAVFTEQLKTQNLKRFYPITLIDPKEYRMFWRSYIKLVPPTEEPLKKSHHDLNELKKLTNLFRKILVDKFEINEII
jgi:hypothetical protein